MSTAMPWRLPAPPGVTPGATALKGASGVPDECPVFSFQRRSRKLNWRDLLHIDLNRLIQTVDLAALHEQLEPITFADIGEDDLAYFTDANFVHLFRLCQLLLEYQLFAWQASTVSHNLRTAKYAELKTHVTKLKAKATQYATENKTLKKELKYCKQVIAALEERTHGVPAGHPPAAAHFGLGGSVGRYPHQQTLHPVPPPAGTMPPMHSSVRSTSRERAAAAAGTQQAQTTADLHAHYSEQFETFQANLHKSMHDTLAEENDKRNAKLEGLQTQLHLLLQAQQDEQRKQQQEAQAKEAAELKPHEEEKHNDEHLPAVTPSQAAQQRLLESILSEVSQLKRSGSAVSTAGGERVSIGAFDQSSAPAQPNITPLSTTAPPHLIVAAPTTPTAPADIQTATSAQQQRASRSNVYKFDSLDTPAGIPASHSNLRVQLSSPGGAVNVVAPAPSARASARVRPVLTAAQQAEVDALSTWLKAIEADELGAEIMKISQEAALISRAEQEKIERARREQDEAIVRAVEETIQPDHPLLVGTILASPRPGTMRNASLSPSRRMPMGSPTSAAGSPTPLLIALPSPAASAPQGSPVSSSDSVASVAGSPVAHPAFSPSGLTIEIMSPSSLSLGRPVLVGNNLIAPPSSSSTGLQPSPRVAVGVSASARAPVLAPAPLLEPFEQLSPQEKAEQLLSLSPSSRVRAINHEKSMIKLRSVISARSSVAEALYAPFPSLPFLPSLYPHSAEDLRESYDTIFSWADTAQRTEEGAQELLRYAVQMDPTGELYGEVAQRVDQLTQEHFQYDEAHMQAVEALAALEAQNVISGQEEAARALREHRWQEDRIAAFEEAWDACLGAEEEREEAVLEQEARRRQEQEIEFAQYLLSLERRQAEMDAMARAADARIGIVPHATDRREFQPVSGLALIPPQHHEQVARAMETFYMATSPTSAGSGEQQYQQYFAQEGKLQGQARPRSPQQQQQQQLQQQPSSTRSTGGGVPRLQRGGSIATMRGNDSDDEEEDEEDADTQRAREQVRQAAAGSTGAISRQHSNSGSGGNNSTRAQSGAQRASSVRVPSEERKFASEEDEDDEFANPNAVSAFPSSSTSSPPRQRIIPPPSARTTYSPHSPKPSKPPPLIASANASTRPGVSSDERKIASAFSSASTSSPARRGRARHLNDKDNDDEEDDDFMDNEIDSDPATRQAIQRMASAPTPNIIDRFEPSAAAQFARPGAAKRAQTLQNNTGSVVSPPAASSALGGGGGILSGGALSRPRTAVGSTARTRFATGGFRGKDDDSFEDEDEEEDREEAARRAKQAAQPLGAATDSAPSTAQKQQQQQAEEEKKQQPVEQKKAAEMHPRDAARVLNPRRAAGSLGGVLGGSRPSTSVGSGAALPAASRPTTSSVVLAATGALPDSDGDVSDVSSIVNLSEGESNKAARQQQHSSSTVAASVTSPTAAAPNLSLLGSGTGGPIVQGRGRPRSQAGKTTTTAASKPPPPVSSEDSLSSLLGGGLGGPASGFGMKRPAGRGLSSGSTFRSKLMQPANDYSEGDSSLDLND